MQWKFDGNAPIYTQLVDQMKLGIVPGSGFPDSGFRRFAGWRWMRGSTPTPCSGRCRSWSGRD